jgi:hypothetical protein
MIAATQAHIMCSQVALTAAVLKCTPVSACTDTQTPTLTYSKYKLDMITHAHLTFWQAAEAALSEKRAAAAAAEHELEQLAAAAVAAASARAAHAAAAEHLGVRGVQNYVFRDGVQQLQAFAARHLDVLSDGRLKLALSLEGERLVKRIEVRAAALFTCRASEVCARTALTRGLCLRH